MKVIKALLLGIGAAWVIMFLLGAVGAADHYVYFGPKGNHCWKEKP